MTMFVETRMDAPVQRLSMSMNIVAPDVLGRRLEQIEGQAVDIEYVERQKTEEWAGIGILKPHIIDFWCAHNGILVFNPALRDHEIFGRVVAYFASKPMARITADTKVMFPEWSLRGPVEFGVEINGRRFAVELGHEAETSYWYHSLSCVSDAKIKVAEMRQWDPGNTYYRALQCRKFERMASPLQFDRHHSRMVPLSGPTVMEFGTAI